MTCGIGVPRAGAPWLVMGASGYVGTHLVPRLLAQVDAVVGQDAIHIQHHHTHLARLPYREPVSHCGPPDARHPAQPAPPGHPP